MKETKRKIAGHTHVYVSSLFFYIYIDMLVYHFQQSYKKKSLTKLYEKMHNTRTKRTPSDPNIYHSVRCKPTCLIVAKASMAIKNRLIVTSLMLSEYVNNYLLDCHQM